MGQKREVFLCHASEEKNDVIRPIATALKKDGITYWLDEAEIKWGDSVIQKVNEGLQISRYVIVVLSESFLSKNYPQKELNSALHIEASTGEVQVLPLLVGTEAIKKRIREAFPILGDKKYESWNSDAQQIVESLRSRLSDKTIPAKPDEKDHDTSFEIPMPKIKRKFTQLDKDRFAKKTFETIKLYFQSALKKIKKSEPEIESDYTEITNLSFIAKIYLYGDVKCQCKIWLGGMSENAISYYDGDLTFNHSTSFSDWIAINDDGHELRYKGSGMGRILRPEEKELLNQQQTAEYFWKQFIERLEM